VGRAQRADQLAPHHIVERYSLFTIILLGESVFAATTAVVAVVEEAAGPGAWSPSRRRAW
jgi:low temperature requirement protein LtrA